MAELSESEQETWDTLSAPPPEPDLAHALNTAGMVSVRMRIKDNGDFEVLSVTPIKR